MDVPEVAPASAPGKDRPVVPEAGEPRVSPSDAPAGAPDAAGLAHTGFSVVPLVVAAGLLILIGGLFSAGGRRRRH